MIPQSQRNRLRSFMISLVSRFLVLLILSSFAVTLLPVVNGSAEASSMPCCADKSSEHCDAGLSKPAPRPVITEPMCGLSSIDLPPKAQATEVQVVTDPIAVEPASVEQECQMDCGACATVTSRHKRQKSLLQARATHETPPATTTRFDNSASFYSSNENWTPTSPRGPPAVR